jgi:putative membrane protein
MSTSAQVPGERQPQKPRRNRREMARTGALVALAVLITLFAVFNTEMVKVNWIFGHTRAPLIIVIVVSLLVGIVLTYFAERSATARSRTGKRR